MPERAESMDSESAGDEGDNVIRKNPDLEVAQLRFLVGQPSYPKEARVAAREQLLRKIEELEMAPFYKDMCETMEQPLDQALYDRLAASNKQQLECVLAAFECFAKLSLNRIYILKSLHSVAARSGGKLKNCIYCFS